LQTYFGRIANDSFTEERTAAAVLPCWGICPKVVDPPIPPGQGQEMAL
jgi:hypothetical protein